MPTKRKAAQGPRRARTKPTTLDKTPPPKEPTEAPKPPKVYLIHRGGSKTTGTTLTVTLPKDSGFEIGDMVVWHGPTLTKIGSRPPI